MSDYTENKTPNLIINTLEDPSKLSEITVGENEIVLVPDETEEEIAKKVDKVSTASQIYGTDSSGNQTTYDKNSFGQVDDVQIHGDSKVVSKIANLSVVEQLNTIPTATVDYKDRIIQYTGETDNTYTNGFFYKCKEIPGSKYVINPEWHNPEGLTSIELDDALIQSQVIDLALAHGYTYVNGVEVGFASKQIAPVGDGSLGISFNNLEQLAQYGFIVTGTPTNNTYLSYNIVENPQPTYEWERVDVQPTSSVADYNNLSNKPQIEGITLEGNLSLSDLGIKQVALTGSYADLTTKPGINGYPIEANSSAEDLGFATVATTGDYNDLINKPSTQSLPELPADKDTKSYMLMWDHTDQRMKWVPSIINNEDLGVIPEPTTEG